MTKGELWEKNRPLPENPRKKTLIDENGRIFGKVNIVDVLIIAIVIAGAYGSYTYIFGQSNETYVTILAPQQESWVYKNLARGDLELGSFTGRIIGEVVNVEIVPSLENKKDIFVTLKVDASNKNGVLFYKDEILRIGKEIEISTERVFFSGTTVSISGANPGNILEDYPRIISLRAENVPYTIAGGIKTGQAEKTGGRTIFEITDVQKIPVSNGAYNIVVRAFISAKKFNGDILFNSGPVKNGGTFSTRIGTVSMDATVTDILPAEEKNKTLGTVSVKKIVSIDTEEISKDATKLIGAGSEETNRDGVALARILGMEEISINERTSKARMTTEITGEQNGNRFIFKNDELKVHGTINLSLSNVTVSGKITGIYDSPGEVPTGRKFTKLVSLRLENVKPWVADKIIAGITETDEDGQKVAEIKLVSATNAEIITTSDSGAITAQIHPKNKDIRMDVQLLLEEDRYGRLLFKGDPIKAEDTINLNFREVDFSPTVTGIEN